MEESTSNHTYLATKIPEDPPIMERRDISEAWVTAIFTVLASVPASVIAGLLIEKFKNDKSAVITINRKEVHLEKGEIVRVIEETKRIEQ